MERINGSEWVWNIVNTYDSEVRNISDRLSFEKNVIMGKYERDGDEQRNTVG